MRALTGAIVLAALMGGAGAQAFQRTPPQGAAFEARVRIALEELRQWRLAHGCGETALHPALMRSARAKSADLAADPGMVHQGAHEHIRRAGYDLRSAFADNPGLTAAGAGEEIADGDVVTGLRVLRGSLYHAIGLLGPGRMHVGMSDASGRTVVHVGFEAPRRVVRMPWDGQQDVAAAWTTWGIETPQPLAPHSGAPSDPRTPVGTPVGIVAFGSTIVHIERAELVAVREGGADPVACWINSPASDPALAEARNALFLIPRAPLEPGRQYRAEFAWTSVSGAGRQEPVVERWTFRVSPAALAPVVPAAPAAITASPAAPPAATAHTRRRSPARTTRRVRSAQRRRSPRVIRPVRRAAAKRAGKAHPRRRLR